MNPAPKDPNACVENGVWTPIPQAPALNAPLILHLEEIDQDEATRIAASQIMRFHSVGCSGDFEDPVPGGAVAQAMAQELTASKAPAASFLFHLGDIVYKPDDDADDDPKATSVTPSDPAGDADDTQQTLYTHQFYQQYASYPKEIFAIAGNHDGKGAKQSHDTKPAKAGKEIKPPPIQHFLDNFCAPKRVTPGDDAKAKRQTMTQPYPYWVLETPVAHIIGLYTNVANGGLLDDPSSSDTPQLSWLHQTLTNIKQAADGKAIVLTLHYPVYSGAANFAQRGDPNAPHSQKSKTQPPVNPAQTLATLLQAAFAGTQCYPDIVLSAHAHLYQRITYTYADGRQIPFLIAGCGGHGPIEDLWKTCSGTPVSPTPKQFPCVLPAGNPLPPNNSANVVAYDDKNFGFLRITVDLKAHQIRGKFFSIDLKAAISKTNPTCTDRFVLDLQQHQLLAGR